LIPSVSTAHLLVGLLVTLPYLQVPSLVSASPRLACFGDCTLAPTIYRNIFCLQSSTLFPPYLSKLLHPLVCLPKCRHAL
jgi:hypothetical protein